MKTDVTVIIPCFNQGDALARAIESALPQCDRVIVVDDHSTDTTGAVIEKYWSQYPHHIGFLRFFRQRGVCAARNAAIQKATTTWILPLDADDWLMPDAVENLRCGSEQHFVYAGWYEHPPGIPKTPAPIGMLRKKNVAHATFLFSRAMWESVGGYDPDFDVGCEDWAFMLALVQQGYHAIRLNVPLYHRTVSSTGRSAACKTNASAIKALLNEKFGVRV